MDTCLVDAKVPLQPLLFPDSLKLRVGRLPNRSEPVFDIIDFLDFLESFQSSLHGLILDLALDQFGADFISRHHDLALNLLRVKVESLEFLQKLFCHFNLAVQLWQSILQLLITSLELVKSSLQDDLIRILFRYLSDKLLCFSKCNLGRQINALLYVWQQLFLDESKLLGDNFLVFLLLVFVLDHGLTMCKVCFTGSSVDSMLSSPQQLSEWIKVIPLFFLSLNLLTGLLLLCTEQFFHRKRRHPRE